MNSKQIFALALGLPSPWEIRDIRIESTLERIKEFHIDIRFKRGSKFKLPDGSEGSVYDTIERTWQHLNLFEHKSYLHCSVPRIKAKTGKVKQVEVPWARKGSGFTLLFESFAMALIEREMPVNKVAELLRVYPKRIWTIFNYWISIALTEDAQQGVTNIGIDETSSKKGHKYVTIAADMDERRVLFATEGKDKETITKLKEHLASKGVSSEEIENISIDMSPSFISGILEEFPKTSIVFDRFHIIKLLNEAMNEVRKKERREHEILKNHKYTFLKKNKNLSQREKQQREELIELLPVIGEAYRLKELFNDLWGFRDKDEAAPFLSFWCDNVEESGITPFKEFVKMIKSHWSGIINYFDAKISNGVLEGINNKIQLAKRRARGYRNTTNFINMILFIAGKLKFNYPHYST